MDMKRIMKQIRHCAWTVIKTVLVVLLKALFNHVKTPPEDPRCDSMIGFYVAELDHQFHAGVIDHHTYKTKLEALNVRPHPY